MRIPLMISLAVLSGCSTTIPSQTKNPISRIETEAQTPGTYTRMHVAEQIGVVYDTVFDAMTSHYFKNFPELDREHTGPMRAYILEHQPKSDFVLMILNAGNTPLPKQTGNSGEPAAKSQYSNQEFTVLVNVAVSMARMVIEQEIGIYEAKFVDKDPIKLMLFEMDTERKYSEYISWVYGEVSETDFKADEFVGNYQFEPGDRIFAFGSSQESWENLCGRQGYLIVRNEKIHEVIVTLMN